MSNLLQDFRYALRTLLRQPLFTTVVVVVLALGIGANTAVFSIIDSVLMRPLPYPQPDKLLLLREKTSLFDYGSCSLPNYLDWRAAQKSCTDLALVTHSTYNLSLPQAGASFVPERVNAAQVSANYLTVLGCPPVLGRDLTEADDTPGSGKVALICDSLWRRVFGRDRNVIGEQMVLDSESYTIIGVLPPTFGYPRQVEILTPLADLRSRPSFLLRDNHAGFSTLGRLRNGVTLAAARAEFDGIARELERRYPATNTGRRISLQPLLEVMVGDLRQGLWVLFGAVVCVLLIACANVANLQLARANGRVKELAVRAALGASRWRLIWQLLAESILLSLLGGMAGILLAMWIMDAIVAIAPSDVPRFHDVKLDWMALAFAALAALSSGLLVGIWPAWRVSGIAAMAAGLREGNARGGTSGTAQVRARSILVVVQVAMAVVLLTGAGLALRSFWRMSMAPLGFRPSGILTLSISLPEVRYKDEGIARFYDTLVEEVRALPGVAAASTGVNIPFDNNDWDSSVHLTGTPPYAPGKEPSAEINFVSPGYFKVMGIPLLEGRDFDGRDAFGHPEAVIVDESFVKRFFPGKDPIGQLVDDSESQEKNPPSMTIIGVVGRTRNDAPQYNSYLDRLTQMHLSAAQHSRNTPSRTLVVKVVSGDPKSLVEPIRQAVLSLDPEVPISQVATMQENIAESFVSQRLTMTLLATFAGLALLLASLGLYGVMALGVTQRTREFGIRLALGAPRAAVLRLILQQGATLVGIGLSVGLVGAWVSGKMLAGMLFGVAGSDPATLGIVATVLAGSALLACWLPARRATRVNPLVALREE